MSTTRVSEESEEQTAEGCVVKKSPNNKGKAVKKPSVSCYDGSNITCQSASLQPVSQRFPLSILMVLDCQHLKSFLSFPLDWQVISVERKLSPILKQSIKHWHAPTVEEEE